MSSQTLFSSVLPDLVISDLVCTGIENFEFHDQANQARCLLKTIHTHPRTYGHTHEVAAFNLHNRDSGIMCWSIPIDELIFSYYEAMYIDLEITNKSKSIYLEPKNVRSLVCR